MPVGLMGWRALNAPTNRHVASWVALLVAWAVVVVGVTWVSFRTDYLSIWVTVLTVSGAAFLVWLALRRSTTKWLVIWLAALAAWLAISVPFMWEFDGPYVTFEAATIQCGHQPAIATNFGGDDTYDLPGDGGYGPTIFDNTYYCSAAEAEAAGYRRTPLHPR